VTSAQAPGVTAAPFVRSVAAGGLSTVLASLPVFLLGGLAVLVRDDLGFSEVQLGLAASTFFTVAALTAVPAGRVAARTGAWAATVIGAAMSAVALVAMSTARSYAVLLLALALGGVANSLAQIGTNGTLAEVVPKHRQGLAFGIKQAAIPAATFVAGFSLPLVGLTLGWRVGFAASALLAVAYVLLAPRTRRRPGRRARRRQGDVAVVALSVVAAAAALASAAVNGLAAFLVESAVASGCRRPARACCSDGQRRRHRGARPRRLARRPAGGRPPADRRRHDGDGRRRHVAVRDRRARRLPRRDGAGLRARLELAGAADVRGRPAPPVRAGARHQLHADGGVRRRRDGPAGVRAPRVGRLVPARLVGRRRRDAAVVGGDGRRRRMLLAERAQ
jgi:hypothetical protein